jgi:hypothetical protein
MKANVFDRELENGDIEVYHTLPDGTKIVGRGPILSMACSDFVGKMRNALFERGFSIEFTVREADKPFPYVHKPGCPSPTLCNCYPTR